MRRKWGKEAVRTSSSGDAKDDEAASGGGEERRVHLAFRALTFSSAATSNCCTSGTMASPDAAH